MTNQPVGIPFQNPTDYTGPKMDIVPIKRFPREPTTSDKRYRIGQVAIIGKDPSTGTEGELWYLAKFEANGDATWIQFDTGTPGVGIDSLLTDDGAPSVGPNVTGVVGLLGGVGIITSGQDPTTDVTFDIDSSVVGQTITGDAGGALSPTIGNWNLVGGAGLDTSGSGSTLTINLDGAVVTSQYDGDSGSATPTAGVLNIIGGNGTVTSAAGNTVTAEMQSPFIGDFSFDSNTGGTTETFTVQNTVNAASSAAALDIKVAGTTSDFALVRFIEASNNSWGFGIDATLPARLQCLYEAGGDVDPSGATNVPWRADVSGGDGSVTIRSALAIASEGEKSAGTVRLHVQNTETAANSDVELLLQTADPADGGGAQSILWGSAGQVQFSLGQGKDATASTQPLEFKLSGFSAGTTIMQIHPGAEGNVTLSKVGALTLQRGTTGERPAAPVNGMLRYNTTTAKFEGYEGGAWANLI